MIMIGVQKRISDETACREFLEPMRWLHGPECSRGGAVGRSG